MAGSWKIARLQLSYSQYSSAESPCNTSPQASFTLLFTWEAGLPHFALGSTKQCSKHFSYLQNNEKTAKISTYFHSIKVRDLPQVAEAL